MKSRFGFLWVVLSVVAMTGSPALADDRVQFFHDISIGPDEGVSDAVCIGCSIQVEGSVTDVVTILGRIEVSGSVTGDAVAIGGDIRLGQGATVNGDAVAVAGRVTRTEAATVHGEVVSLPGLGKIVLFILLGIAAFSVALSLSCYLIAGQGRVQVMAGLLRDSAGLTLLIGIGMVAAIVVSVAVSSLIWPLTPFLILAIGLVAAITLVVGYTGVSFWLGGLVFRELHPLTTVLAGAVMIVVLQVIPVLGFFAFLIFSLLAFGSAALSGYGTSSNWLMQRFPGRQPVPPATPGA